MSHTGNAPERGRNMIVTWSAVIALFGCIAALSSVSLANPEVAEAFKASMGD